ncbi:MC057L [Molluscum contagiosum virus subtype 1]|uniref:Entry-fusion complex protein OPG086 n=3 Tax=Molluscum contagiosum virus TaxID=10279 RepID=A0A7G5AX58_MCV1|nr:MC057L [Molluscum contagiosum virus subtype 1]AZT86329.1 MC057L [Molluscum contagiosum virus]AAC55185.1 MC057L [Molluscum contagiosum virus subtype 1]AQY16806.1 MC057 [Molluscum contagiosum virus subtype 1]AQY17164.1 MC057 [Molluscum contagiosum virus subtype 1]AYO87517.1 MC057 [Molluscum contagiosum virus subtype 1]
MTSLELAFLAVFICCCYFLNCCPTNKHALVLRDAQARAAVQARADEAPRARRGTLLLARGDYVSDTLWLRYDARARAVRVARRESRWTLRADDERERRMLLPILLLSK